MGLLKVLYYYRSPRSRFGKEVDYQLYSWGEIGSPFLGDREHSVKARCILDDFPFKLVSSSPAGISQLPQKLCLTFKTSYEVGDDMKIGYYSDEAAKEFGAFLSLVTRRRVFSTKIIRSDGLPIEQDVDLYQRFHFQERQKPKVVERQEIYHLLDNLQAMNSRIAEAFILAMRLYHSAIEMMYTQPEFSYIFLITCLEAISSAVHEDYRPPDEEGFLDSRFCGLKVPLNSLPEEQRTAIRRILLKSEKFAFQKLTEFVKANVPERFWSDIVDDAKPDYLEIVLEGGPNGRGREVISHSDITIHDLERIERGKLPQVLRKIYDARSNLIHKGIRLPESIVFGFSRVPIQAVVEITEAIQKNQKLTLPIPPLLTFERLVSYSMREFLAKQQHGV